MNEKVGKYLRKVLRVLNKRMETIKRKGPFYVWLKKVIKINFH